MLDLIGLLYLVLGTFFNLNFFLIYWNIYLEYLIDLTILDNWSAYIVC